MIVEHFRNPKQFTATEQQIIEYAIQHPRLIINLSLQELSRACYVSEASIIRFCKKLGVKGYSEFKIQLAQELTSFSFDNTEISSDMPILPYASMDDIAHRFFQLSTKALEDAKNSLDYTALEKAASMLFTADTIHLFGRGESLLLAEDFHYKLLRLGLNSSLEALQGFQETYCHAPTSKKTDVALVISQYCNSQPIQYILDELIYTKTPFILITAETNIWPYNKLADITMHIPVKEQRGKMGSFASRTAFQYLLDCLYGKLFSMDYTKFSEQLSASSQRKISRNSFYKNSTLNKDK